jgi:mRNA interferase MazF
MNNLAYQTNGGSNFSNNNQTTIRFAHEVIRGYIFYANLGENKGGSVQFGSRPCIIWSNNSNNRFAPTVNVIPLSTKTNKMLPVHVLITGCGLNGESIALTEQITTINKSDLISYIGKVDEDTMMKIERASDLQQGKQKPIDIGYINKLLYLINEATRKYEKYGDEYFIESRFFNREQLRQYCEKYNISFETIMEKRIITSIYINRDGVVINGD